MPIAFQRLMLAAAALLLAGTLRAQTLTVILQQPPPNMLNVEHLWAVQIINPTTQSVAIRLRGNVTGEEQGLIVTGESTVLTIPPGTRRITYNDVQPATANFVRRDLESIVLRTGSLPSGDYRVCVTAVDATSGTELGTSCIQQRIQQMSPPRLVAPQDGAGINERQPVIFTWLPPAPLTGQIVRYQLRVVEVLGTQSPEAAFRTTQPYFTTTLNATAFTYPPTAPQFLPTRRYAWRVVAEFDEGLPALPSEVWTFGIEPAVQQRDPTIGGGTVGSGMIRATFPAGGCVSGSPMEIPTPSVRVTFTSSSGFSNYALVVYENPCGRYPPPDDVPPPDDGGPPDDLWPRRPGGPEITTPPWLSGPTQGAPRVSNPIITVVNDINVQQQGGGNNCSAELDLQNTLQPGEAAVYQIAGSYTDAQGRSVVVLSDPECIRYRPIDPITELPVITIPCPKEKVCELVPEEKAAPAMNGGLEPPTDKLVIPRDDYVPLRAVGADADQFWWYCTPKLPCPETPSTEMTLLSGRVRFEWKIIEGEGDFVEIGCLPEMRSTVGEQVIFKPPYVRIDSVKITRIELSIIDDNPTQPKDETVKRLITIRTERPRVDSTKHHITITSPAFKLPAPTMITGLPKGSCRTVGPEWRGPNDLIKPKVILPPVPKSDTLIFREWIVLKASDNRDPDHLIVSCKSQCTPGVKGKDYEDDVQWTWSIVSGGGRFVKSSIGRHVIYEAPMSEGTVEIEVEVYNPGGLQIEDKKPERTRFRLEIVRPGMEIEETPRAWRPAFDVTLTMIARQKINVGGQWRDPLPHQCRIVDFHLDSVSNEPGIALNWDDSTRARNENLDLRFRQEDNTTYTLSRAPATPATPLYFQHAETERMIVGSAVATPVVFCEDWGAYGRIAASARLYDSVPKNPVWMPRDDNGNRIADGQRAWDRNGAAGSNDDDRIPAGDGHDGDGYSNYEEYRGFYLRDRTHIRTRPTRKDLFINDRANLGVGDFAASRITHHLIDSIQMDAARVVNFNDRTAHAGDQHGLVQVARDLGAGLLGQAVGGPGLPRQVTTVEITTRAMGADLSRSVIAHEITHGCNVFHHGEGWNWIEDLCLYNLATNRCSRRNLKNAGGFLSGDVNCYMRYDAANYWCPDAAGTEMGNCNWPEGGGCTDAGGTRFVTLTADGVIGHSVCTSATGTGANAAGACSGNAAAGRGNCRTRLRVKDF